MNFILLCAIWLLAAQIDFSDLKLLSGKFNYRPGWSQAVTWTAAVLVTSAAILYYRNCNAAALQVIAESLSVLIAYMLSEWILARISPKNVIVSILFRLIVLSTMYVCHLILSDAGAGHDNIPFAPALLCGLYFRNSPFGVVHGKDMHISELSARPSTINVRRSFAEDTASATVYRVTDYGIRPNSGQDVTGEVQHLIERIGQDGGGSIFFPAGKYLFNTDRHDRQFIHINCSNVTVEGETAPDGEPLAELICCGNLVNGDRNPWISPSLITTGEAIQPSNIFWGADFRQKRHMRIESSSLSDPGSDGNILTPDYATDITSDTDTGETVIRVSDSSKVSKYILVVMYNTSSDGNLIRDILGVGTLREEWLNANRAGEEGAPSFQYLTEVRRTVDAHSIELTDPLPRTIDMKYSPCIFNVPMLENITIRNLKLSSRWNGLFRHHGFPFYYSVRQSQEMDYGWNAINMKRVAGGRIENLVIRNYTNPLYVMDSLHCMVRGLTIGGYDGHQGLKVYCHACHNHFSNIRFLAHFADMMGGEGNAYCNTFEDMEYCNSSFKPVDYDFHGFAESPMSPPAWNVFRNIRNFRYIKGAGPMPNLPSCAQGNVWTDTVTEGEQKGTPVFYAMTYRPRRNLVKYATAAGYTAIMVVKKRRRSISFIKETYLRKISDLEKFSIPRNEHYRMFVNSRIENIRTTCKVP